MPGGRRAGGRASNTPRCNDESCKQWRENRLADFSCLLQGLEHVLILEMRRGSCASSSDSLPAQGTFFTVRLALEQLSQDRQSAELLLLEMGEDCTIVRCCFNDVYSQTLHLVAGRGVGDYMLG